MSGATAAAYMQNASMNPSVSDFHWQITVLVVLHWPHTAIKTGQTFWCLDAIPPPNGHISLHHFAMTAANAVHHPNSPTVYWLRAIGMVGRCIDSDTI